MSITLAAILASPPLTTGQRTLARLEMAREILGYDDVVVANVVDVATRSTGELATVGGEPDVWVRARPQLRAAITQADVVMLGYGCTEPSGPARLHFRAQAAWLQDLVNQLGLPVVMVGNAPRHPSRWQRWTSRQHPDLAFPDALRLELTSCACACAQRDGAYRELGHRSILADVSAGASREDDTSRAFREAPEL